MVKGGRDDQPFPSIRGEGGEREERGSLDQPRTLLDLDACKRPRLADIRRAGGSMR
jgi:hypothetical protein